MFNKRIIHRDLKPDNILLSDGVIYFYFKNTFSRYQNCVILDFAKMLMKYQNIITTSVPLSICVLSH